MPRNKTDNFLKAIKKYAKAQKGAMSGEVKQLKTERLKEAEENGKRDSRKLVKEKLAEQRSHNTARFAAQTREWQKELFLERVKMTEEVFKLTAAKLTEYTKTEEYSAKLFNSAREMSGLFGENGCVLYIGERDLSRAEELKALFAGGAEVVADKTIKIGGIKGFCESMGIIADDTLDSKLEDQRGWFTENAALSVL